MGRHSRKGRAKAGQPSERAVPRSEAPPSYGMAEPGDGEFRSQSGYGSSPSSPSSASSSASAAPVSASPWGGDGYGGYAQGYGPGPAVRGGHPELREPGGGWGADGSGHWPEDEDTGGRVFGRLELPSGPRQEYIDAFEDGVFGKSTGIAPSSGNSAKAANPGNSVSAAGPARAANAGRSGRAPAPRYPRGGQSAAGAGHGPGPESGRSQGSGRASASVPGPGPGQGPGQGNGSGSGSGNASVPGSGSAPGGGRANPNGNPNVHAHGPDTGAIPRASSAPAPGAAPASGAAPAPGAARAPSAVPASGVVQAAGAQETAARGIAPARSAPGRLLPDPGPAPVRGPRGRGPATPGPWNAYESPVAFVQGGGAGTGRRREESRSTPDGGLPRATPPPRVPGQAVRAGMRGGSSKGRAVTGVLAAAVTTVLAFVIAGQFTSGVPSGDDGSEDAAGAERGLSAEGPASRSGKGRGAPDDKQGSAPTYTQKMGKTFSLDSGFKGKGDFKAVQGTAEGVGGSEVLRYRVDVEKGLPLESDLFAEAVQKTLNDKRSWAHGGERSFERVEKGDVDFVITLASSPTTDEWCAKSGLDTSEQNVSCDSASTDRVMINAYRWAQGSKTFGDKRMLGYRQMLINHEVGHRIGRDHVGCPKDGDLAPVMMQQTKSLTTDGAKCRPNPWPYPRD